MSIGIRTRNPAEVAVATRLVNEGYTILKNGWPDFLAFDDHGVRFIEVKPTCRSNLSYRQRKMAGVLSRLGISVELVAAECVCGRCSAVFVDREIVPLHDGRHPDCLVCQPIRKTAEREAK